MAESKRNSKGHFPKGNKLGGRRKMDCTVKDIHRAFNRNHAEIRETFEKYMSMSQVQLEKLSKSVDSGKPGKLTVRDALAIKYVYNAVKYNHTDSLVVITNILAGGYGIGVQDVSTTRIEEVGLSQAYEEFVKTPTLNKTPFSVEGLVTFLGNQPALPSYLENRIKYFINIIQKYELADVMPYNIFEAALKQLHVILSEVVGKRNAIMFSDVVARIRNEVTPILRAGCDVYSSRMIDTKNKISREAGARKKRMDKADRKVKAKSKPKSREGIK
jgi:polyhydroxyalkanoate synthesis regulator protein